MKRRHLIATAAAAAVGAAAAPSAHAAAPDLVFRKIAAPTQIVTNQPFTVTTIVASSGARPATTATLLLSVRGAVVAQQPFRLAANQRRVTVKAAATLTAAGATKLAVTIAAAKPAEKMRRNNTRRFLVGVADFQLRPKQVITPSFTGYGAQFNHHVYAQISRDVGVTDENVREMERKVRDLRPGFSRIFFNLSAFSDPDRMQSFIRTVQLAQTAGATINITWQGGRLDTASGNIQKFADVLIDLVRKRGITRLRWVTLQNEPNRTRMTPEQYEAQYRELDPYIQSIRGQVKYMLGDLVRAPDSGVPNQQLWFDYISTHMADVLDAWSIKVFWDYWDTAKLVARLTEVRAIWDALPENAKKPLYVSEYGVRGLRNVNGVAQVDPGVGEDGVTPITATNMSAFQHAWFDVLAAQLGYRGTSKWDAYFAKYDRGTQAYYMIGAPGQGWPAYPIYNVMRLFTHAVTPGWRTVGITTTPGTTRLVAAFVSSTGRRTVLGLDTAGGSLNTASPTQVPYTIGGFRRSRPVTLTVWNDAGDGTTAPPQALPADAAGVVTLTLPQQAVFALSG